MGWRRLFAVLRTPCPAISMLKANKPISLPIPRSGRQYDEEIRAPKPLNPFPSGHKQFFTIVFPNNR